MFTCPLSGVSRSTAWILFGLAVLCAAGGCDQKLYRASAWMRLEPNSYILRKSDLDEANFLEKQRQLILSPLVLEPTLARPDIATIRSLSQSDDPVKLLQQRLEVETSENSELVILRCDWEDPEDAATICNAVVESYFRMHTQDEAQRSTRMVEVLEDERARRLVLVQQLADQLDELKEQTSHDESPLQKELAEQALRATYMKLAEQSAEVRLKLTEFKLLTGYEEKTTGEKASEDGETPVVELPDVDKKHLAELEFRVKVLAARQAEVLQELEQLAANPPENLDLEQKQKELAAEKEVLAGIEKRIMALRVEMHSPAKITLLRRAEPPNQPLE